MENILEYLIPLIFIVAFLSMRKKKKQKQKEMAEKAAPDQLTKKERTGGMFGKLNKMLNEYYEADLKGAPDQRKEGTRVEEPFDSQPPQRELEPWEDDDTVIQPVAATIDQETKREMVIKRAKTLELVTAPVEAPEPVVVEPTDLKMKESQPMASSYRMADLEKADLRRAIVWSEILGPPKALRDE